MKRRFLPLALALALCLSLAPVRAYSPSDFSDVPSSHWAYGYVSAMAQRGVINGVGGGRFDPDAKVSAAMLVTLLGRTVFPETTVEPWETWYGPYAALAVDYGWLEDSDVDTARLDAPISRYDMAVVLSAAAMELGLYGEEDAYLSFTDHAAIPARYRDAVGYVCSMGLINGDGAGNFNGAATMSRAEAAAVLYRLLEQTEDYADEGYDSWDFTPAPTAAPTVAPTVVPTAAPEETQPDLSADQGGYTGKSGQRFPIPEAGLAQVAFDGEDRLCTAEWVDGKSADSVDTYLKVYLDGKEDGTSSENLYFALTTDTNPLKKGIARTRSDFSDDVDRYTDYLWIDGIWHGRFLDYEIWTVGNGEMFDDVQLVVIDKDGEALTFYFYIEVENDGSHLIEGVANVKHGEEAVSLSLRESDSGGSSDSGTSGGSSGGSSSITVPTLSPQRCAVCSGSGVCRICHGKGKVMGNIVGDSLYRSCPSCIGGSGRCRYCGGDGWLYD